MSASTTRSSASASEPARGQSMAQSKHKFGAALFARISHIGLCQTALEGGLVALDQHLQML
jgi:hypothetical protein